MLGLQISPFPDHMKSVETDSIRPQNKVELSLSVPDLIPDNCSLLLKQKRKEEKIGSEMKSVEMKTCHLAHKM